MILTPDELVALTRRKQFAAQARVLQALGVRYGMRPDGSLVVSSAHVEATLGGAARGASASREPAWDSL